MSDQDKGLLSFAKIKASPSPLCRYDHPSCPMVRLQELPLVFLQSLVRLQPSDIPLQKVEMASEKVDESPTCESASLADSA